MGGGFDCEWGAVCLSLVLRIVLEPFEGSRAGHVSVKSAATLQYDCRMVVEQETPKHAVPSLRCPVGVYRRIGEMAFPMAEKNSPGKAGSFGNSSLRCSSFQLARNLVDRHSGCNINRLRSVRTEKTK